MKFDKSLQRTFDPPPIFAVAKTGVASNAAEFMRYVFVERRCYFKQPDSELRAQRVAEQNSKGDPQKKGGDSMEKTVLYKAGRSKAAALVALGWLSFIGSYLSNDPLLVVLLRSIARVLP